MNIRPIQEFRDLYYKSESSNDGNVGKRYTKFFRKYLSEKDKIVFHITPTVLNEAGQPSKIAFAALISWVISAGVCKNGKSHNRGRTRYSLSIVNINSEACTFDIVYSWSLKPDRPSYLTLVEKMRRAEEVSRAVNNVSNAINLPPGITEDSFLYNYLSSTSSKERVLGREQQIDNIKRKFEALLENNYDEIVDTPDRNVIRAAGSLNRKVIHEVRKKIPALREYIIYS